MSRSGYSDDCDNLGLWRGAVHRAITGYRGQHLLKRLRDALDAMPAKRLIADEIQNTSGEVCALGALDPSATSYDARDLADHFGVAWSLAAEITYLNDEAGRFHWVRDIDGEFVRHDETPEERWKRMRAWVSEHITVQADD
jgi:hypothetical protein